MHFIFMRFILCGFPIFMDFAFLNWQMLVTVVFAYLRLKYLWINNSQRGVPGYIYFLMHCDALARGSFLLQSYRSTLLGRVQYSLVSVQNPHSCCHWVRTNLSRSDMLPHLETEKEGIRTPQPTSTKRMVVKEASSISEVAFCINLLALPSKKSFDKNDCHYQSINVLVWTPYYYLLITLFGETRYNLHTVIWFYLCVLWEDLIAKPTNESKSEAVVVY